MQSNDVRARAGARILVMKRAVDYIQIGGFGIDTVMRRKYMSREKFLLAIEKGFRVLRCCARLGLQRSTIG